MRVDHGARVELWLAGNALVDLSMLPEDKILDWESADCL
jgi:hypothetical protein